MHSLGCGLNQGQCQSQGNDDTDIGGRKQQKPSYHIFTCKFPISSCYDLMTADIVMYVDVAKLDHAVNVAAIHQWRRRLSACVKTGSTHCEHCF